MGLRTETSLADLLRVTVAWNLDSKDQALAARLLGLTLKDSDGSSSPLSHMPTEREAPRETQHLPQFPDALGKEDHDGLEEEDAWLEVDALQAEADAWPVWAEDAPPMEATRPEHHRIVPPDPLFPKHWRTTNALASCLATVDPRGRHDIDAAVRVIAAARPLERIPRLTRRSLRKGVIVLQDRTPGLEPFTLDVKALHEQIRDAVGHDRVDIQNVVGWQIAAAADLLPKGDKCVPLPGTPVVAVTDLGAHVGPPMPDHWRRLLERLRDNGSPITVVTPYPRDRLPPETPEWVTLLLWDAVDNLPNPAPAGAPKAGTPVVVGRWGLTSDAAVLAEAASPAILITPWLLRRLRRALLKDAGPEVERDLWFSAAVATRDHAGIELEAEAQRALRRRLEQHPERFHKIETILADPDRAVVPAFRLEERIALAALRGASRKELNDLLLPALAAVAEGRERGIERWAEEALPELPEAVRQTKAYRLIAARLVAASAEGEPDRAKMLATALRVPAPQVSRPQAQADGCFDVFLSYEFADRDLAAVVRRTLEKAGLSVWDVVDVRLEAAVRDKLMASLQKARLLVSIYSPAYADSEYCNRELTAAYIGGGPERIVALLPGKKAELDHIRPRSLRKRALVMGDVSEPGPGPENEAVRQTVERIRDHAATLQGPMPRPVDASAEQQWFGISKDGTAPTFVGRRHELWSLHELLTREEPSDAVGVAIQGAPGMGKTALAAEYARRFAAAYPAGIFWFTAAGGGASWLRQLRMLAAKLGVDEGGDAQLVKRDIAAVLGARDGAYLWIVDDALPDVSAISESYKAPSLNGCTILASNTGASAKELAVMPLAQLEASPALRLLEKIAPPKSAPESGAARYIAEALQGYPLALHVAARLAQRISYQAVREVLEDADHDEVRRVAEVCFENTSDGDAGAAAAVMLHAIQGLTAGARRVLDVAALLGPGQPVPMDILPSVDTSESGDSAWLGVDELVTAALARLTGNVFVVQATTCRIVREVTSNEELRRLRRHLVGLMIEGLQAADDIRRHGDMGALVVHAAQLTAELADEQDVVLQKLLGDYHFAAGSYRLAVEAYEACLTLPDVAPSLALQARTGLGAALLAAGAPDRAYMNLRQALVEHEARLAPGHPAVLKARTILGNCLRTMGRYSEAAKELQYNVYLSQETLGAQHPDTLSAVNNRAEVLLAQGQFAAARQLYEEALDGYLKVLGSDHPATLDALDNLASLRSSQGELGPARALQEEVLSVRRRVLGAEHPDTLTSMNNLASTLWAQGQHAKARALQEEVLLVRRRVLGAEHPDTLTSMNNLAVTLWAQGRHAEARALQEEVLASSQRVFGRSHPRTADAVEALAKTPRALGEKEEANALLRQAEAMRSEGPDTQDQHYPEAFKDALQERQRKTPARRGFMRHNVFISHVAEDNARLGDLKDLVGRAGRAFSDSSVNSDRPNQAQSEGYIKAGVLADRIRGAGVVVVLVSPMARASKWVDWEIRYAQRLGKPIIGVWGRGAQDADVPDALELYGRALVPWRAQSLMETLEDGAFRWMDSDGKAMPPRVIPRHCGS